MRFLTGEVVAAALGDFDPELGGLLDIAPPELIHPLEHGVFTERLALIVGEWDREVVLRLAGRKAPHRIERLPADLAQRGLDAISIIAVGRASRSIHTPHDTIERLHVRGFEQAGRVALSVIGRLVKR